MGWWLWVLVGFGLLVVETITPGGFFFIFFGIAALLVGVLAALGAAGPDWMEWLLFTVFSVAGIPFFRRPLMRRFNLTHGKAVDNLVGETAVVLEEVAPGGVGKAEMRGSSWTARTAGAATLPRGRRCRAERIGGLSLWLRAECGESMRSAFFVFLVLALFVFWVVAKTAVVVPQQNAYVVERLGRFSGVLDAGFHILVPFVDAIRYRHLLKEQAMDIPEQVCITKDNVQVAVDGILYLKVMDPERASYGISNYNFAITQLAQTTLRSEIGKIDLDRTFEERTYVNTQVVTEVDKASEAWGVKVLRYEIKNITPPQDILAAMEKQMRAEREKRAVVLQSEGERDAAINTAEGTKQQVIKASEAKKQQQINEAEGQASAILAVARATAEGISAVARSIQADGGFEAVQLRVAEQYLTQFGQLAKTGNSLIIPSNLADVGSVIATAMNVIQSRPGARPTPPR